MAKRYTDTETWEEDWFILLPPLYKLLWKWITDKCDHAGIWKPNIATFIKFNGEVDLDKALEHYNDEEKTRLMKLENGKFFLPGFFVFQYGPEMNLNNKVHYSINQIYNANGVSKGLVRGLVALKDMDKDKEKDKNKKKGVKTEKPEKEEKTVFAPFVSMTDEEYSKLIDEHGPELTGKFIHRLDNYKASNGKKYKDDYRAILSWVVDAVKEKEPKTVGEKKSHARTRYEEGEELKRHNEQLYGDK
jgi:hypothetical protein